MVAKIKESGLIDKLSEQWWRFERRNDEGITLLNAESIILYDVLPL